MHHTKEVTIATFYCCATAAVDDSFLQNSRAKRHSNFKSSTTSTCVIDMSLGKVAFQVLHV